jgi:hypothetical protein
MFGAAASPAPAPAATGFSFGGAAPSQAPAPAASGFSFGGAPAAAPAPAPAGGVGFSFGGGAPAPAPAPTAAGGFSFGATPAPAPAPAPSTGFSFGSTASAPAPAPSTGFSFGSTNPAPAPAPGLNFGGLGASPAPAPSGLSSFGGLGGGTSSQGGFGQLGGTAAAAQHNQVQPDTMYDKLPPQLKSAIDSLWSEMSQQRRMAADIEAADMSSVDVLHEGIALLRKTALAVETSQASSRVSSRELKELSKQALRDGEKYGHWSLQEITSPQALRTVEKLPSPFMWELLRRFESRLEAYLSEVRDLEVQLDRGSGGGAAGSDNYGQRDRVGPQQLKSILMTQHEAFMRVAGHVATVHQRCDDLRDLYRRATDEDPFTAADRAKQEEEWRIAKQLRQQQAESAQQLNSAAASTPNPSSAAPAPGSGFGGLFGSSPVPAAAPTSSLFGAPAAAPASALGFAALPPSTTPSTSLFGSSFGAAPNPSGSPTNLLGRKTKSRNGKRR